MINLKFKEKLFRLIGLSVIMSMIVNSFIYFIPVAYAANLWDFVSCGTPDSPSPTVPPTSPAGMDTVTIDGVTFDPNSYNGTRYNDRYSTLSKTVISGSTYSIDYTTSNIQNIAVWIDWEMSGTWGWYTYFSAPGNPISITVPSHSTIGTPPADGDVRMRIMYYYGVTPNACNSQSPTISGEIRDYKLHVVFPPIIQTVTPAQVDVNPVNPVDITVLGTDFKSGVSNVWFDGNLLTTTFVDAQTLTASIPINLLTVAGSYNVQVKDNDGNALTSANSAFSVVMPPPFGDDFSAYANSTDLNNFWQFSNDAALTLENDVNFGKYMNISIPASNTDGTYAFLALDTNLSNNTIVSFNIKFDNFAAFTLTGGDVGYGPSNLVYGFNVSLWQGANAALIHIPIGPSTSLAQLNTWYTVTIPVSSFTDTIGGYDLITDFSTVDGFEIDLGTGTGGSNSQPTNVQVNNINSSLSSSAPLIALADIPPIGGEVNVFAAVDPVISYTLDTTNCSFGDLTSATVKTCVINVAVATNATSGYTAFIRDVNNGTLISGTDNINAVIGTSLSAGTEAFGVSTSVDLQNVIQEVDCSAASLPINVQPLTTSNQSFSSADAPVPGDDIVLCMAASITDTTAAGSYSDTAYVTVVGNF